METLGDRERARAKIQGLRQRCDSARPGCRVRAWFQIFGNVYPSPAHGFSRVHMRTCACARVDTCVCMWRGERVRKLESERGREIGREGGREEVRGRAEGTRGTPGRPSREEWEEEREGEREYQRGPSSLDD
jgi:hypothetical protein